MLQAPSGRPACPPWWDIGHQQPGRVLALAALAGGAASRAPGHRAGALLSSVRGALGCCHGRPRRAGFRAPGEPAPGRFQPGDGVDRLPAAGTNPSRRQRSFTCWPILRRSHTAPSTTAPSPWGALQQQVDLPMPGVATPSTSEPATRPPPAPIGARRSRWPGAAAAARRRVNRLGSAGLATPGRLACPLRGRRARRAAAAIRRQGAPADQRVSQPTTALGQRPK